jgi:two-component system response regulator YesN
MISAVAPGAVVQTAGDGLEAVVLARANRPDVAFLDIRMPRMDGLKAAAELAKIAPEGTLYVLTAHEEFAYAQQALSLGIEEYLLKPVSSADLGRCLRTVEARLEEARARARREAELRSTLSDAMPLLRAQFARDLCLGAIDSRREYAKRAELFELQSEPNVVVTVGLRPPETGVLPLPSAAGAPPPHAQGAPETMGEVELEVLRRQATSALETLSVGLHPGSLVARIAHDEVVVLVPLGQARLGSRQPRIALRRLLAGLFDAVAGAGLDAAVGVGGFAAGALDVWRSYRAAARARQRAWLLGRTTRRVLAADDLGELEASWLEYPLLAERGLAEAVRLGLGMEAGEYLRQLVAYFSVQGERPGGAAGCPAGSKPPQSAVAAPGRASVPAPGAASRPAIAPAVSPAAGPAGAGAARRSRLLECLTVLARGAVEGGAPSAQVLEISGTALDNALRAEAGSSFVEVLTQTAGQLLEAVARSSQQRRGTLAARAAAHVEGHFPEHISLTQIADELHVSPFYLSHVFREEMEVTFSEFLAQVRVREAQRLLSTTSLPVGEVAARVGYREPNYFGRVFKKATGMTPLAWRRRG